MRIQTKLALLTATMALGAAPALALGPPSGTPIPTNTGTSHMPTNPGSQGSQGTANKPSDPGSQGSQGTANKPATPGANASLPAKAKAYGKYCKGESKQHVDGTPGTPFSKCVTDMAKLANGSAKNPRTACKGESKKHVDGQHGTPFSLCAPARRSCSRTRLPAARNTCSGIGSTGTANSSRRSQRESLIREARRRQGLPALAPRCSCRPSKGASSASSVHGIGTTGTPAAVTKAAHAARGGSSSEAPPAAVIDLLGIPAFKPGAHPQSFSSQTRFALRAGVERFSDQRQGSTPRTSTLFLSSLPAWSRLRTTK